MKLCFNLFLSGILTGLVSSTSVQPDVVGSSSSVDETVGSLVKFEVAGPGGPGVGAGFGLGASALVGTEVLRLKVSRVVDSLAGHDEGGLEEGGRADATYAFDVKGDAKEVRRVDGVVGGDVDPQHISNGDTLIGTDDVEGTGGEGLKNHFTGGEGGTFIKPENADRAASMLRGLGEAAKAAAGRFLMGGSSAESGISGNDEESEDDVVADAEQNLLGRALPTIVEPGSLSQATPIDTLGRGLKLNCESGEDPVKGRVFMYEGLNKAYVIPNSYTYTTRTTIESAKDLADVTGVSGSLSLSFGAGDISAEGEGSYLKDRSVTSNKVCMIYSDFASRFAINIKPPGEKLKPEPYVDSTYLTTLNQPNKNDVWKNKLADFYNVYGTNYINQILYGAALKIDFCVTSEEIIDKDSVKASLDASINKGKLKGNIKGKFEKDESSGKSEYNLDITIDARGANVANRSVDSIPLANRAIDEYLESEKRMKEKFDEFYYKLDTPQLDDDLVHEVNNIGYMVIGVGIQRIDTQLPFLFDNMPSIVEEKMTQLAEVVGQLSVEKARLEAQYESVKSDVETGLDDLRILEPWENDYERIRNVIDKKFEACTDFLTYNITQLQEEEVPEMLTVQNRREIDALAGRRASVPTVGSPLGLYTTGSEDTDFIYEGMYWEGFVKEYNGTGTGTTGKPFYRGSVYCLHVRCDEVIPAKGRNLERDAYEMCETYDAACKNADTNATEAAIEGCDSMSRRNKRVAGPDKDANVAKRVNEILALNPGFCKTTPAPTACPTPARQDVSDKCYHIQSTEVKGGINGTDIISWKGKREEQISGTLPSPSERLKNEQNVLQRPECINAPDLFEIVGTGDSNIYNIKLNYSDCSFCGGDDCSDDIVLRTRPASDKQGNLHRNGEKVIKESFAQQWYIKPEQEDCSNTDSFISTILNIRDGTYATMNKTLLDSAPSNNKYYSVEKDEKIYTYEIDMTETLNENSYYTFIEQDCAGTTQSTEQEAVSKKAQCKDKKCKKIKKMGKKKRKKYCKKIKKRTGAMVKKACCKACKKVKK